MLEMYSFECYNCIQIDAKGDRMFVTLENIDKLYELMLDLELYVYLQGLVEFDSDGGCVFEHEFRSVVRNAQAFLFEKQLETVQKLDRLIHSKGFLIKNDDISII